MTKPNTDAVKHHIFEGKPAAFIVRYDPALLKKIKQLAIRNNESMNKTINELCKEALQLRVNSNDASIEASLELNQGSPSTEAIDKKQKRTFYEKDTPIPNGMA